MKSYFKKLFIIYVKREYVVWNYKVKEIVYNISSHTKPE